MYRTPKRQLIEKWPSIIRNRQEFRSRKIMAEIKARWTKMEST